MVGVKRALIESLSRVVLLFLVDDDSYDDASEASEDSEEEEEEQLDSGHGGRLGILGVVPRRLEVGRGRGQPRSVLGNVLTFGRAQVVKLHRHDVVVVRQITGCRRRSEEVTGWQFDSLDAEAGGPRVPVVEVVRDGQLVVVVLDGQVRVVLEVPELDLAPADHGVRAVTVVVVIQAAVVDHAGQVRVLVVVRSIVIAVRVGDDGESGEVVSVAKHRTRSHLVSRVPHGETVTEQILGRSRDTKLNLKLPVSRCHRDSVPDGTALALLVGREPDVAVGDHGGAQKVPVRQAEAGTLKRLAERVLSDLGDFSMDPAAQVAQG